MPRMKRVFVLALLAALPAGPLAHAQTTLRYQFKEGEKLEYAIEQKMTTTAKAKGTEEETKLNLTVDLSWQALKVDGDKTLLQIKITHAKVSVVGPKGKIEADSKDRKEPEDPVALAVYRMVKTAAAMEIVGTMLPTGEIKDAKVTEESLKALKNLAGGDKVGDMSDSALFKMMATNLVFPAAPLTKGKTWSNKTEAKMPLGTNITENTFTYEGPTDTNGVTLEKIAVNPSIKIETDPKAPVTVEMKNAKGGGVVLFDNKAGRLVESSTNQTTTMQLTSIGLALEQTIDQSTMIRLKSK